MAVGAQVKLQQGTIPSSPAAGYIAAFGASDWTQERAAIVGEDGSLQLLGQPGIARIVSAVAIANTETQVCGVTIPANWAGAGAMFRIKAWGRITSGVTGGTATYRIRFGTTTLTGNIPTSVAPTNANSVTNAPFYFEADVVVRTSGAGGTVIGECAISSQTAAPVAFTNKDTIAATSATVALDTTAAKIIELTYISGNAGTTATFEVAYIECIGLI